MPEQKPLVNFSDFLRGNSRMALLALALIFILALGLRIYGISEKIEAPDENLTLAELSRFTPAPVEGAAFDFNPPLYYFLVAPAYLLAPGLASVRLMGALFGALTVLVIFFLAREFMGENKSLLAAFLFAIYPYSIVYSQQARNYALAALLFSVSLILWARLMKGKGQPWHLAAVYAAMLYAHYFLIFGIIGQAAVTLLLKMRGKAPDFGKFVKVAAIAAALSIPLFFILASQYGYSGMSKSTPSIDPRFVLNYPRHGIGLDYGFNFNSVYGIFGAPIPRLILPILAAWALALAGMRMLLKKGGGMPALVKLYFAILLIVVLAGFASPPLARPQYIFFTTPLFILFIARGADYERLPLAMLFCILVLGWLQAILFYYSHLPDLHYIGLP
ncbi:MAG: glycosyltransferase family 39 protein [Candidatus Diapherotrites archaeon]